MARRGGVHLLLQQAFVHGADRVLRPPEHLRARSLRLAVEGELGDGVADPPLDALGTESDLVVSLALAPHSSAP